MIKYTEFLIAEKSLSKVTAQRMSYFCIKMCLELYNYGLQKSIENAEIDNDTA